MKIIDRIKSAFKRRYVYRSAVTGKFVSRAYAEAHPTTTYRVPR